MTFEDLNANYRLALSNGVLVHRKVAADEATASATVKLQNKSRLLAVAMGDVTSPGLEVSGDESVLQTLAGVLD